MDPLSREIYHTFLDHLRAEQVRCLDRAPCPDDSLFVLGPRFIAPASHRVGETLEKMVSSLDSRAF